MADKKGNAAMGELAPATRAHASNPVAKSDTGAGQCAGCGGDRHGSVGREIACLESHLEQERAQNRRKDSEIASSRAAIAAIRDALRGCV